MTSTSTVFPPAGKRRYGELTGPEHYLRAQEHLLLAAVARWWQLRSRRYHLAAAAAHATLATAASTALAAPLPHNDRQAWLRAAATFRLPAPTVCPTCWIGWADDGSCACTHQGLDVSSADRGDVLAALAPDELYTLRDLIWSARHRNGGLSGIRQPQILVVLSELVRDGRVAVLVDDQRSLRYQRRDKAADR